MNSRGRRGSFHSTFDKIVLKFCPTLNTDKLVLWARRTVKLMCFVIQLALIYIYPEELINWDSRGQRKQWKTSSCFENQTFCVSAPLLLKNASLECEERSMQPIENSGFQ